MSQLRNNRNIQCNPFVIPPFDNTHISHDPPPPPRMNGESGQIFIKKWTTWKYMLLLTKKHIILWSFELKIRLLKYENWNILVFEKNFDDSTKNIYPEFFFVFSFWFSFALNVINDTCISNRYQLLFLDKLRYGTILSRTSVWTSHSLIVPCKTVKVVRTKNPTYTLMA